MRCRVVSRLFSTWLLGESSKKPDRYPLNSEQAFIVNVALAYPFYIVAILLPGVIWLGLAQVLFGMFQIIVHGIVFNVKMRSWYNPGLATVVFLHFPIGIYYIWYVATNALATTGDYIGGILATVVAALLIVAMPLRFLADKDSTHPFSEAEMRRFGVRERIEEGSELIGGINRRRPKFGARAGRITRVSTTMPSRVSGHCNHLTPTLARLHFHAYVSR